MSENYSYEHIYNVINDTANDIIEAAGLPETGAVDAINLLVSATLERLAEPKRPLSKVVRDYGLTDDDCKPLSGKKALEEIIGWMHQ